MPTRAVKLLESAPSDPADILPWIRSLSFPEMDRVWVFSVVSVLAEFYPEHEVADLARTLNAVRDAYRGVSLKRPDGRRRSWERPADLERLDRMKAKIVAALPSVGDKAIVSDVVDKRQVVPTLRAIADDPRFKAGKVYRVKKFVWQVRRVR